MNTSQEGVDDARGTVDDIDFLVQDVVKSGKRNRTQKRNKMRRMKVRGGEVPTSSTSSTSSTPSAAAPAAKGLAQRHTVSSPLTSWQAVGLTASELELEWLAGHAPSDGEQTPVDQISEVEANNSVAATNRSPEAFLGSETKSSEHISYAHLDANMTILQEVMLRHLASFLAIISICAMTPDWTESAEPAEFAQHVLTRTILPRGTAFARTCILERTAGLTTGQRPLQAKAKPWFGAVSGRQWQDEHGFGAVSGRPLQSDTHWLGAVSGRQMQEQVRHWLGAVSGRQMQEQVRHWFGAVSGRQLQDACKSPHILYVVCYAHFEAFTVLTRFMRLLHIVTQTLAVHSSNTIYRESWEQFAVPSEHLERGETPDGDTFDNRFLKPPPVHYGFIPKCCSGVPGPTSRVKNSRRTNPWNAGKKKTLLPAYVWN